MSNRITIAVDEKSLLTLQELKECSKESQSEICRKAIKFYSKYKKQFENNENFNRKIDIYIEMLSTGEHLILDLEHYLSILKFIEDSPDKEKFWEEHEQISRHHAEEFTHYTKKIEEVLERLATCNLFKIIKETPENFSLLLGSDIPKTFIRIMLKEIFTGMGFNVEINEGFSKLRVLIKKQ